MDKIQDHLSFLEAGHSEIASFLFLSVSISLFISIIWRKLVPQPLNMLADKRAEVNAVRKKRKGGVHRPDYPNGWYAIIQSNKLRKKVATEAIICGKEVVIWRGENGVAYVADAYCPHLGAHLGVEGEVKGNCIQCPFHNWQFDGTQAGKLTCIPYSQKVIENIHLKMWPTLEMNGFIWIWYHGEDENPSWMLPTLPELKSRHVLNVLESTTSAHVQEGAENSADYSHFNALHGPMFPKKYNILNTFLPITIRWDVDWKPGSETGNLAHVARAVMKVNYIFFGKWSLGQDFVHTLYGPGMAVVDVKSALGSMTTVATGTPIGPMQTRSVIKAYCSNRAIQLFQWFFKFTLIDQLYRDIGIWNHIRYTSTPLLVKEDAAIKAFRKWYSQFYSTNWKESAVVRSRDKC